MFLLPLFFLIVGTFIASRYVPSWRHAVLVAAICFGVTLTVITEVASLFHQLSFIPLSAAWVAACLIVVGICIKLKPRLPFWKISSCSLTEKILIVMIGLITLATGAMALWAVPNTWDSMTYHLPRMEHWIQNRSVEHYPTHIIRQLFVTVWPEYVSLNFRLLGGGESSANWVQWLSMAGSLTAVSLIASRFSASRRGQLLACLIAATLPMGLLQSVSTQTDYVSAFWLVTSVLFLLEAKNQPSVINSVAAALAIGVSCLTKATNIVFILPFMVWYVVYAPKKNHAVLKTLTAIVLTVLILNFGYFLRNTQTFGSPLWTSVSLTNASIGFKTCWANILRNCGLHMGTPYNAVNEGAAGMLYQSAKMAGVNINDPDASFTADEYRVTGLNFDEDRAGNPLHFLLLFAVLVVCCFIPSASRELRWYVLFTLLAGLFFCLMVRYQPWHSRFHLPLFVLFAPVAATVIDRLSKGREVLMIAVVLFICAWPWILLNSQHPWAGERSIWSVPRLNQYFYKQRNQMDPYKFTYMVLKEVSCRDIGLIIGEDTWEYPWWGWMHGDKEKFRIEHVQVTNASGRLSYPSGSFQPCAIITNVTSEKIQTLGNHLYVAVRSPYLPQDQYMLFLKRE